MHAGITEIGSPSIFRADVDDHRGSVMSEALLPQITAPCGQSEKEHDGEHRSRHGRAQVTPRYPDATSL